MGMHTLRSVRLLASSVALALLIAPTYPIWAHGSLSTAAREPGAGAWRTWVLGSGSQLRLPAPPDAATTAAELIYLQGRALGRDPAALERIRFWDTGAPGYRWDGILRDELARHGVVTAMATTSRESALVDVAIYDATIAAWDSKYAYQRPRPAELDPTFSAVLPTPPSPSYPSEHAAAAGAASAVLAYLFPDDAEALAAMADEAAESRVLAGLQYPSDIVAGLALGRQVADLVIEHARHDGSEVPWTGSLPTEPGRWSLVGYPPETQPAAPAFGTYKPWMLSSPDQLRPAPPPAVDSPEQAAELVEVRDFPRTFATNQSAFFWQSPRSAWSLVSEQKTFEYRLDQDAPRAARAAALVSVAGYDATIACWDAKYSYWAMRPFQLDAAVQTLFPTPASPSYPSAHGCLAGAQAAVLGYLFPGDAAALHQQADEAARSRLWAGVNFRTDIEAGLALGRSVADLVIDRARGDGSD